jgi:CRISPR system Cascade subunit CasA
MNLRFAESARWLLHVMGFDDTAAKPSERGQGMPSPGAGWLGKLGLITAVGNNLFETLLLNLVLLRDAGDELWGDGKAIWEEPLRTKERVEISIPNSQAALLTLQSRRLLLKSDGNVVTGYFLQGGDFFPKENATVEQMTVWRNNSKKESALPEYVPKRHNPSVQMWRDFGPLVGQVSGQRCPGVISWLKRVELDDPILRFQICGVKYGDKDFFVEDVFSDSLSFNASLLSKLHEDWIPRIIDELKVTDSLVREVGVLAQNIAKAAGDVDGYAIRDDAREQAYFRLDKPFRRWLERINPNPIVDEGAGTPTGAKMDEECKKWWEESQAIVRTLGNEMIQDCSPQAFTGRNEISAPKAFNWFLYNTSTRDALSKSGITKKKGGAKNEKGTE